MENKENYYYLGKNKWGKDVYMPKPHWDCDWYWGFGYLETFKNNDLYTHTHFDSEILNTEVISYDAFKNYFPETPLLEDEIWELLDYMQTFYTLKTTAELFRHGYSYFTERAKLDILNDTDLYNKINKEMLPAVFDKIDNLFNKVGRKQKIDDIEKEYSSKIDVLNRKLSQLEREKKEKIKQIMEAK